MANYYGTTASNGGKVKKGKEKELQAYLDTWGNSGDGDLHMEVRGNYLAIYGGEDFDPMRVVTKEMAEASEDLEEGELDYNEGGNPEGFLQGLVPFLEVQGKDKDENLIVIHTVGAEKCRFPLGALEYILRPSGEVDFNGFKIFS